MPQQSAETINFTDAQPHGAAKIGSELRAVRESLGWRLDEVAAGLRIRLPYLEAIENGELSVLPGAAYQTGFVRTYAQALGLDAEEILRRFRAEGMGVVTKAELSFLAPVPDRAVPTGAIVLVGVVLVLAGYGLWYRHTETERRLADAVPSVPAELAPLAMPKPVAPMVPVQPAKPAPVAPAVAPSVATSTPAVAPLATQPAQKVVPATPPAVAPSNAVQTAAVAPPPAAALPPPPPAALPPAVAPAAAAPPGQTIVATADSWVEVKDPTGNILFSKVLHAGESWPVPDEAGLTMTAGNAGATEIADGGKTSPPLGAAGAVVRDYALTPGGAVSPDSDTPAKTN
jgi:cytoskeleton protein RodZ